jgi:broad specificity phosphatase PhoE
VRYLLRHADAGDKHAWTGPDYDRPLSSTGQREADGLIALLADYPIGEIVSSPAVRCWQTVQPLAERRRLAVRTDDALAVDADVGRAVALLLDNESDGALLCTHGELIKPLLGRLRELGAPISQEVSSPKGSVWLLETADGAVTSASYLPPYQTAERPDDGHGNDTG